MGKADDFAIFKRLEFDIETCTVKFFLHRLQRFGLLTDQLLEAWQYILVVQKIRQPAAHEEDDFRTQFFDVVEKIIDVLGLCELVGIVDSVALCSSSVGLNQGFFKCTAQSIFV